VIVSPCVIVLNAATNDEREAVQAIVRVHARGWWHRFADAWIVGGYEPAFWKTLIKPVIPNGSSSVLILALPESAADKNFAYYGVETEDRNKWLLQNLRDGEGVKASRSLTRRARQVED
jgi:hypothetical protein